MPAHEDGAAQIGAGVGKSPGNEPARGGLAAGRERYGERMHLIHDLTILLDARRSVNAESDRNTHLRFNAPTHPCPAARAECRPVR
jgi:hypothetical protein